MNKTVYIMRHGQTLFNALSKIQGFCDSPLTEYGIAQAKIARAYFERQNIVFDEAHSSTMERAVDTLELVTNLDSIQHKGIKEWNFGTLEGESERINPPLPYKDFFVKYGGEEETAFQTRVRTTIHDIVSSSQNDVILIVVHGAVLGQFNKYWIDHAQVSLNRRISNCAVFKYTVDEQCTFILEDIVEHDFSSIEHLKQ